MSIKVMTMVFDRYPEGGNERLLALALADHARDDGTRIWPSVAELSRKTMQSERTVQRQIGHMVDRGWLVVVSRANGRPGGTNEYRIAPAWIDGGELPPRGVETGVNLSPVSGGVEAPKSVDNVIHTGDTTCKTGDTTCKTGDTAMSPESSGTINEPIPPIPPVKTGGCGQGDKQPEPDTGKTGGSKDRMRWRWADKRSTIEERAEQLGLARWDEAALARGGGEVFAAFAARVFASHLAAMGVATSPGVVRKAIDASSDWSVVLKQLAGHAEPATTGAQS